MYATHLRRIYTAHLKFGRYFSSATVDQKEMDNFAKLSNEWWDESGSLKALHSMNRLRIPWIRDILTKNSRLENGGKGNSGEIQLFPLKNIRILDVGCGAGILCEPLAKLGANVIGLDIVEENIEIAKLHFQNYRKNLRSKEQEGLNLQYVTNSVEDFAENLENLSKFDAIVASEVVEHVTNYESFLKICINLLKPRGVIFVTTLNKTLTSKLLAIYVAENLLNIVPRGIHDWDKFVTPEDLEFLLERQNLSVRMIHGLRYNPLTNIWRWSRDTSVNYALHAVKNS